MAAYAVCDWIARSGTGGNTVTLSRLAREPGAVGRAFKLDESDLLGALEPVVATTDGLALASPTGAVQLSWSMPPATIAVRLLDDYYGTEAADAAGLRAGDEGDRPIADALLEELGLGRNPHDRLRRLHNRDVDGDGVAVGADHRATAAR